MSGFSNALVLKDINDADIDSVETFMREEMLDLLPCDISFENKAKFFGNKYANAPSRFKLLSGERKLIKQISVYVDQIIRNDGLKTFAPVRSTNEKKIGGFSNERICNLDFDRTSYFLTQLQLAADKNSTRSKGGYRYDPDIKQFATYLRMIGGSLAYQTIQENLECALPSISSTNRYIKKSDCHIVEGILRCDELLIYLNERNLPLVVSLSEDATRITGRIQYDPNTNQVLGLTLPISKKNGAPIPLSYPARNVSEIYNHFSCENSHLKFANVIMAQPLANAQPFCLMLFGSNNKYTSKDVANRWEYIVRELAKLNINVLTVSSDSDPKYNSAMRDLSKIGYESDIAWFSYDLTKTEGPFYIQDSTHVGTKLRNFFLRTTWNENLLPFGTHTFIRIEHLYTLINNFPKDLHQMTKSTLNPLDRQNFQSVSQMCDERVIKLLETNVPDSSGTVLFLQIVQDVTKSFMNPYLQPIERVEKIWYALFIVRIWRQFIFKHKNFKLNDSFLSGNCYSCIELNAHCLVMLLIRLKHENLANLFQPHLMDSQPCESTFRQFRSFTSTYSMVANCSIKEMLSRLSKIQLQNDIIQCTAKNFNYPKLTRTDKKIRVFDMPNSQEIFSKIEECKIKALSIAKQLGLTTRSSNEKEFIKCHLKLHERKPKKPAKQTNIRSDTDSNFSSSIFKNIQLKDYTGKLKNKTTDEKSSYTEVNTYPGSKKIIVKKSSLCWLFQNEYSKLSSDRLLRVKTSCDDESFNNGLQNKVNKVKCTMYRYKPQTLRKRLILKRITNQLK